MRSIRHILIVQPYGIGDALFVTPLLRTLRTLPTVETVDLLLGSRTELVFRNNPHVDRIFSIDKGKWHVLGKRKAVKDLVFLWKNLHDHYDLLVDFSLQREYGFYGLLLNIPCRIGLDYKKRGLFLTQRISLGKGYEGKHAEDFYCDVGKLIGLEVEDRFLEFYIGDEDRKEGEKVLQDQSISKASRFVAIAPGGGESWGKDAIFKRWPAANFSETLSLVRRRFDFEGVLVLGSQGERQLGEEVKMNCQFPVVNLCGELSLGACAAVLKKAVLFLANDGGLVHLAHALHVPLVAFYGPVDPRVYGPYPPSRRAVSVAREGLPCRPCYSGFRYNSACVDRECLTALTPREVVELLDAKNFWSHEERLPLSF